MSAHTCPNCGATISLCEILHNSPSVEDLWEGIKGNEHVKRAVEITLAGNHNILFIGPPECGKSMFREVLTLLGHKSHAELRPCPCGNYSDQEHECYCTPAQIAKHRRKAGFRKALQAADITIKVMRPRNQDWQSPSEPLSTMLERINAVSNNGQVFKSASTKDSSAPMEQSALSLLEMAYNKLHLTPAQRVKAVNVAATIARLDHKQMIEAAHISEAIQYRTAIEL